MRQKKYNKAFTILELLVVIAIVAILAVIVVPNFIGAIDKSKTSAELAEVNSVSKAVSMYYMDHGAYPVMQNKPITYGNIENVDFDKIYPTYLNKLPHFSYWIIDYAGRVYHIKYNIGTVNNGILTLSNEYKYKIFDKNGNEITDYTGQDVDLTQYGKVVPIKKDGTILPDITSEFGGLEEHPQSPDNVINRAPTAIISMTPDTGVVNTQMITWGYESSTDPDGDEIISAKWQIDGGAVITTAPSGVLSVGSHTISLMVQDSKGTWSQWTQKTFNVTQSSALGKVLTSPESGWKRYDDTDSKFTYGGNVFPYSGSGAYQSTQHYTHGNNKLVSFKFYGKKLRIITATYTNQSDNMRIVIDGVEERYSTYTTNLLWQSVVYERIFDTVGIHTVEIYNDTSIASAEAIFDAIDIDDTGSLQSTVGQAVTEPELGWKRYDDTDSAFTYGAAAAGFLGKPAYYNGTGHYINSNGKLVSFKFFGKRLRIISVTYTNQSDNMRVVLDGIEKHYSTYTTNLLPRAIVHEETFDTTGIHTVEIYNESSSGSSQAIIDAVDIDSSGYLVAP